MPAVSANPTIEVPRPLIPQGPKVISSSVVDIYPLQGVTDFQTTRRDLPMPAAFDAAESARYMTKLVSERDFLVNRLGKTVAELPVNAGVEAVHKFFIDNGLAKLGLRHLSLNGNSLTGEHCLVPHPAYALYGTSSNQSLRAFGANLGAALMLTTSDGKLLLQHRKPENRVYGDVPGASIAGLVDAPSNASGKLDILEVGKQVLLAEGREEVGFAPDVTEDFELTTLQIDKVALHHEITFASRTCLTSDEITRGALANRHKNTAAAFSEHIVFLDATPQVVERLLTEVLTPFPMTHSGPLLMLGYDLAKKVGLENPDTWLLRVKQAMDENYALIDGLSDGGKYSPDKCATMQGLPSFRDELQRVFKGEHSYVECGK
jgi:hypothetical protein